MKPKLLQGTHGTLRFLVPPTVELSFFNRHPSPLSSPFQSLEAGAQLRESLGARTSCDGFCKGSEGQHHVRWGDDGCSPEIWTRSISGNLRKDAACFDDCFGHPLFISEGFTAPDGVTLLSESEPPVNWHLLGQVNGHSTCYSG